MDEFLNMGGHGFYIWGAYGSAFLLISALILGTALRNRKLKAQLSALGKD